MHVGRILEHKKVHHTGTDTKTRVEERNGKLRLFLIGCRNEYLKFPLRVGQGQRPFVRLCNSHAYGTLFKTEKSLLFTQSSVMPYRLTLDTAERGGCR